MLIRTGDHDDRVVPLHSYKYVAELQYRAANGKVPEQNPILLSVSKNSGHNGGYSGLNTGMSQEAETLAFFAKVTNS